MTNKSIIKAIRARVVKTSLAGTAKVLQVPRGTLASYLADACRAGSAALIETRATELGWADPT